MTEEFNTLKRIVEGALLATGEALSVDKLLELFDEEQKPEKTQIVEALQAIQSDFEGRGFALVEVASGWRFQVCADLAPWVNRLWEEKPQKYSRALLETLSLIAYRQPLTRGDIEEVRGVAVSSHIIKTLAEREWIKVVGHRDVPGRPSLYATTRQFLDYFGLKSLDELPSLGELKDIDSLNADLNLGNEPDEAEQIAQAKEGVAASDDETEQDAVEAQTDIEQVQVDMARDEVMLEQIPSDDEPQDALEQDSDDQDSSAQDAIDFEASANEQSQTTVDTEVQDDNTKHAFESVQDADELDDPINTSDDTEPETEQNPNS